MRIQVFAGNINSDNMIERLQKEINDWMRISEDDVIITDKKHNVLGNILVVSYYYDEIDKSINISPFKPEQS